MRELVAKYLGDALGTKGLKLLHKWCGQSNPDVGKINKLFYIVLRNLVLARYGVLCRDLNLINNHLLHVGK